MNATQGLVPSPIHTMIDAYLTYKRSLNRKYRAEESALRLLERFMTAAGIDSVQAVGPLEIDRFLSSRPRTRPRSYNHLLCVLRIFFQWLVIQGTLSQTPVMACARRNTGPRLPYLFDLDQARRLLDAASALADNPRALHRGISYETMFALLYGLGLRVGEVARLTIADVDMARRLLVIRETKFSKNRLVPFGPHLADRLNRYLSERFGSQRTPSHPLFSFTDGQPVNPGTISLTFHHLLPVLKLEPRAGSASPRLHDLRHSFAVRTLLRWYRSGINPNNRLLHLSTFLGHVDPASTAVYLTITDELFEEANKRFEDYARRALPKEDLS